MTRLHLVGYFGVANAAETLLRRKHNPDQMNSLRETPLSLAAWNGHEAVVKLLLATDKVDVDSKDCKSQTPLLSAAQKGHEVVVKLLLPTQRNIDDRRDGSD